MDRCRICAGSTFVDQDFFDDRYGYPGLFAMTICSNCGHKALRCDFSSEMLVGLYTNYYPRSTFSLERFAPAPEARGFAAWLNGERRLAYTWVPEKVRVLDIGCGFGESLGYHSQRECDVYGVEADENIRRMAEKFGFKVHVGLFDPELYEPDFFDYVTLDQVVEHMSDPVSALRGVAKVLKPGGVAVISTPNANGWGAKLFGRRWINWHAPYHLQHFSRKSVELAAAQAGLQVESVRTITSSEWLLYQWIHLLAFPKMGTASVFWSPQARRGVWERAVFILCRAVHRTKINHLLTRLFDAAGVGDNHLFFLRKP